VIPTLLFFLKKDNNEQKGGIMYKQITILTVLICFLAAPALAAQMSVEPAYQEAFQGDNITVNIVVDPEGSEVYGASYILYFNNTVLNATSQVKGPFLTQDGAGSMIYTPPTGINNSIGQVEYVETRSGASGGVTDPGVLTTITFQVIGEDGISQLNLGDSNGLLLCSFDPPYIQPIPTTVNNGSVEVRKGICGDVNDDGDVNMADVMTLWYDYANYPTPGAHEVSNVWAADVNCDGAINMADVMTLWYDYANYPTPGEHVVNCCGG